MELTGNTLSEDTHFQSIKFIKCLYYYISDQFLVLTSFLISAVNITIRNYDKRISIFIIFVFSKSPLEQQISKRSLYLTNIEHVFCFLDSTCQFQRTFMTQRCMIVCVIRGTRLLIDKNQKYIFTCILLYTVNNLSQLQSHMMLLMTIPMWLMLMTLFPISL